MGQTSHAAGHNMMRVMAFIGGVGWIMLVVPELHFLYKHLIPALGGGKYLAFVVMGVAMFFCLPIVLTRKSFSALLPAKCQSLIEKLIMGLLCVLFVMVSRCFMQ